MLAVSLQLFVRRSFAGTTVRDIAKGANLSPGLMFHYFDSKQALLEAHGRAVESAISSVVQLLEASTQPLETFRVIARMILESFQDEHSKNLFLLANQILTLDSIPATVRKMVSPSRSIAASIPVIVQGQRLNEIRNGDAQAMAVAFWGALQGVAEVLTWSPGATIPDPEQILCILKA